MDTQQPHRRVPKIQFRVLIVGRANAGKTTILQRVCETTDAPIFYRILRGKEKVKLNPSIDRGEHTIDDELVFSNHKGYIFHDSRGIESGSTEELGILQAFIQRKCRETRLENRLHAIWYCVPMDNQRPQLDLKFFQDICPDRNVPVIAVFTKFDQFLRNVQIHVEDFGSPDDNVSDVAEKQFQEHYLRSLGGHLKFVRLEKMHRPNMRCDELIEATAAALNDDMVALMLLAVQRDNIGLSVKTALNRVHSRPGTEAKEIVRECLVPFPYIWFFFRSLDLSDLDNDGDYESLDASRRYAFNNVGTIIDSGSFSELEHAMSHPMVQNLTHNGHSGHHLILAVILFFKHATLLRLSGLSSESALTQAELDYREANIDLKIQEHLTGSSQDSVELSARFIMATDIESSRSSVRTHVHGRGHWFKRLGKPAFLLKS